MSGRQNNNILETLFSFELLVEFIQIEKENKVSDEVAVGIRLLDFPTLLIYQPQQKNVDINQQKQNANDKRGEYTFNRGKSCFFKMSLNSLHIHLSNNPLYAMVLDVKEDVPKLIGSSTISLAKVMDRISRDVTEHGVSTPSSHGERGLFYICTLTGEKIGSITLSYKLLSLGASLLPYNRDRSDPKSTRLHGEQHVQEYISESFSLDHQVHSLTPDRSDVSKNIQNNSPANVKVSINEHKQDDDTVRAVTEHRPRSRILTQQETENSFEEDLSIFCPPHLYYTNSAEEKSKAEEGNYKLFNQYPEAVTFEESEDETVQNEFKAPNSPVMHQKVTYDTKMSTNQETGGLSPNVRGEALHQLPLLNALLVELSQLNGQNSNQPLSSHPSLAWIYRPASTEPSAGQGKTPQTKSSQKTRLTSPHFKRLHAPRNCSTPIVGPLSVKKKAKQEEALIESKSPRKKLVYGTTKTFNLRLKQISGHKVNQHECMDLKQNDTHTSVVKGKTKSTNKIMRSSKRKSVVNQSSGRNDNIETMIQSITVKSALRESLTLKEKNLPGIVHGKQNSDSLRISEKCSLSERDLKIIHIPTVNSDSVARNKDMNEHHSESNQSYSECDKHREKIESSESSRHSSPESSFSDSSGEGNEEARYADDFNSLEPSDAYSPDPVNSPESSRAKTPKSPVCSNFSDPDSSSETALKRTILPVAIKAPSSPKRALRGTHIIRPRTHASALSFSSDDGDRGGLLSLQTSKKMTKSSGMERTSGAERFVSSGGESRESTKTSSPVQGFSPESVSSFECQEAEELADDLGSLDFRKEYQHISELVVNNLPGYTM